MKTDHFFKASPITERDPVEPVAVIFDVEIVNGLDLDDYRDLWTADGERLEDTLYHVMPGSVYDQLLIAMLERKASLFKVSHAA